MPCPTSFSAASFRATTLKETRRSSRRHLSLYRNRPDVYVNSSSFSFGPAPFVKSVPRCLRKTRGYENTNQPIVRKSCRKIELMLGLKGLLINLESERVKGPLCIVTTFQSGRAQVHSYSSSFQKASRSEAQNSQLLL